MDAVERLYREISAPKPPTPSPPTPVAAVAKIVTRADVDAIIQRKRPAAPEELQDIIARAVEF